MINLFKHIYDSSLPAAAASLLERPIRIQQIIGNSKYGLEILPNLLLT